jgi:Fe-S-cluster containining protein
LLCRVCIDNKENLSLQMDEQNTKPAENTFPQYLCKMCGRCCRSITAHFPHDQLVQMAGKGSEGAKVFTDIFKPYSSIEEARKVVPEQIEQVLKELSQTEGFNISNITFYYCPHISSDNKCGIYETRPECCRRAPAHGWSCMPPGCGFEGWQFEEREKLKRKVRKLKEHLLEAEAVAVDGVVPGRNIPFVELKKEVEQKISRWEKFGSALW